MLRFRLLILLNLSFATGMFAQHKSGVITNEDFLFLEEITKAVLDTSRIHPGQALPAPYGRNNTGGILIRPGGRDTYPSFWIRDYAMSLETGFVSKAEQKHMLLLTASTQCDQTWITRGGSMVPFGAIADHIRVDDLKPIFFPGTYDYEAQGTNEFGTFPAYCDQFYFIHMADYYFKQTSDLSLLSKEINGIRLIDRLEIAFKTLPARRDNEIVYTTDAFRGVDFGFRDAIAITGDLSYSSILKYRAANQLSAMFSRLKNKIKAAHYKDIAVKIKAAMPRFLDKNGMLTASDGRSRQPDVWATAFAIYLDVLEGEDVLKAARHLEAAYKNGTLAYKGSIRHIIKDEDFNQNTAWETAIVGKNQYQNGAYWGTPTGWVSYAIAKVNKQTAAKLIKEYINELRENDFRKGSNFNAPYECFYPGGYTRGPVYLTTVACPYIVLRSF
ncbi:hypothetical protein [Pedobacter ginsengisoli]|uniref:hypothetical protein n=1 Tax=Pedobacter ginsengisoli TaxID=363852 RepID=UPI00254A1FB0|nr:hypothetical protein [Pedobacter ginsengisoli]